jgi:hypothetical protein
MIFGAQVTDRRQIKVESTSVRVVPGVNGLLGKKAALNITFPYLIECTPWFGLPYARNFSEVRFVGVKLCPE